MTAAGVARPGIGNRIAPARYLMFLGLLPVGFLAYREWVRPGAEWQDALAMSFDLAAAVFLVSLIPLLRGKEAKDIRADARANDANRFFILGLTTLLTLMVMTAIAGELDGAKGGDIMSIIKLVATLVLIWLFANSVYALHYAHLFYTTRADDGGDDNDGGGDDGGGDDNRDCGGLDFPGSDDPTYPDFAYFAFTLGMTFQTSDVSISARPVRNVALLHSIAAFVFNIGVIAFTINTLGGG